MTQTAGHSERLAGLALYLGVNLNPAAWRRALDYAESAAIHLEAHS